MMEKEHQNKTCSHLLGIVSELNEFHTIPSQTFTTYNSQCRFSGIHNHFFQKESITTQYSYSKSVTHLRGP